MAVSAGGNATMVSVVLASTSSMVAVTVTVPVASAVTRPVAEMVASAGSELAHETARPVSDTPCASRAAAASCSVRPTKRLFCSVVIATEATGRSTVTTAVASTPSTVAVSTVLPGAMAVTTPLAPIDATDGLDDDHTTGRPVTDTPFASRADAVTCCVMPTDSVADGGVTRTVATGSTTVMAATPDLPSTVAVMEAVPLAMPVTVPSAFTVAMVGAELVHVIARRSASSIPPALRMDAVNTSVLPRGTRTAAGVSVTEAARSSTTTAASATRPPDSAEIVVVPTPVAVTTPAVDTVATAGLADDQATARPARIAPAGFRTVTERVRRSPMNSAALLTESMVMLPMACGDTVITAESALPAAVARMTVVPDVSAVTVPWLSTSATAGKLDRHTTGAGVAPSS